MDGSSPLNNESQQDGFIFLETHAYPVILNNSLITLLENAWKFAVLPYLIQSKV